MLIKYPNRRLYDTEKSRYMRVDTVRERVLEGESVMMHHSSCDITASILVQIMAEDINTGRAQPDVEALREFIRNYQGKAKPKVNGK